LKVHELLSELNKLQFGRELDVIVNIMFDENQQDYEIPDTNSLSVVVDSRLIITVVRKRR
jgi:hypothetical protein